MSCFHLPSQLHDIFNFCKNFSYRVVNNEYFRQSQLRQEPRLLNTHCPSPAMQVMSGCPQMKTMTLKAKLGGQPSSRCTRKALSFCTKKLLLSSTHCPIWNGKSTMLQSGERDCFMRVAEAHTGTLARPSQRGSMQSHSEDQVSTQMVKAFAKASHFANLLVDQVLADKITAEPGS